MFINVYHSLCVQCRFREQKKYQVNHHSIQITTTNFKSNTLSPIGEHITANHDLALHYVLIALAYVRQNFKTLRISL